MYNYNHKFIYSKILFFRFYGCFLNNNDLFVSFPPGVRSTPYSSFGDTSVFTYLIRHNITNRLVGFVLKKYCKSFKYPNIMRKKGLLKLTWLRRSAFSCKRGSLQSKADHWTILMSI